MASGTVTFVFTDIEGSTRLLATYTDLYPDIVRRQREIVAEATHHFGGRVVGHEGDSCFLAFDDATAAIHAAGLAQARLTSESWPGGVSVKVRMGIHSGTVEQSGGDYYGIAVHTAARVTDAAHGGQVIMSGTTCGLGLPTEYGSIELGTHRLKSLEGTIELHQLTGPGLATEFPPPRALPSGATRRTPTTSFVGREAETGDVMRLLDHGRLITVLGPGGIGKTRFALHVGQQAAASFPDGVWFADLTATEDPDTVGEAIADAVGVSTRAGGDPVSVVADVLAHAKGLLIVDNFEHVMEAAPVIAALVAATEHLKVLVTSRERLRLNVERIFELEPLALHPDGAAVQLFCDRARAVRPDFSPGPTDIDAIVRICRRLDGLPLAIELAAARTRLLQPAEIAERLARSAIALGGGSRDVHARHQTIRATVEWSYQLLSPAEQDLMSKLAIFAGPIRVDAIDVVLGSGDGETADVLADLVDKSLLQQRVDATGTTRVRMLELIREFADERLAERSDAGELGARHAAYYAEFAELAERSMLRDMPDQGMRRIEADFADIARAFDWSLAHDPPLAVALYASLTFYFHSTGMAHTARRWEELTRSVRVDPHLAARRSIGAGYVAFGFRLLDEAREHWQAALPGLRDADDRLKEAWATMSLGATHIGDPANHDDAVRMIERGIALADQAAAPVLVGLGFNIVGELSRVHGDDDAADAAYLAATQVARTIGDHYREAVTTGNRVYIASHRGDHALALSQGRAALDIHRRHGHHNQVPWVSLAVCGVLVGMGRVEEACVLMGAADEAARRMLLEELPGDVNENAAIRQRVTEAAGDAFSEWYDKGRLLPLDEAVRLFADE